MCADVNDEENTENHVMKKGCICAAVAVGAMLWTCVALAADARPCARILFEPMPRLATTAFPA